MLAEKFHRFVLDCEQKQLSIAHPSDNVSKLVNENSDSVDENSMSNGIHEVSPDKGHTLPILKKILDLNTKIQDLKKQHIALSDQVKLSTESFPGTDVLKSMQLLGAEYELLKRKYLEESSERRKLYNEVIELKGNIRVFCRCRPLNESEIANGSASVVNFESSADNELQVICSDSSKKQFKFDHVFGPEDNQEAVFQQTKPIVTSVLDGYNVCIFAYGQTGTGKTFTMEGTPEHRGVNYRTLEELFRITEERHGTMKYELSVSMLEVYNEKIRDLLVENSTQPTKKLEIKQAAEGTQEVPGLVEARVYGTEDVWEMLKTGNRVRSVGSTCANELSSLTVMGENLINGQRTKSHLWLVDLAGSERVGKTEAEGERLKESQFINKSLSALGDVISALASKSAHIPYRQFSFPLLNSFLWNDPFSHQYLYPLNSKLTHMLQSSLGGDCKTLMFVQISPSAADLGETLCSLNFASRVRGIESGPARKQVDHTELLKYKQMAEKLKQDEKETKKLQDNLQIFQLRLAAREHHCRTLQEKVRDLENQIAEERKNRLKQESRALAAVSAQPSSSSSQQTTVHRTITDKKPPMNPSKLRLPLGRITNYLPPQSPLRSKRYTTFMNGKENSARRTSMATNAVRQTAPSTTQFFRARRRVSSVMIPPAPSTTQIFQPRRRVSCATLPPPHTTSDMTTPLRTPAFRVTSGSNQHSLIRSQRKDRYSSLFAPMPELRASVETTPMSVRRSIGKFMMGSPAQSQADSRVGHPTALALQRKPVVWSPLKLRGFKNNRKTPPKQKKLLAALNPVLIKETLNKVDQCVARLQELQYTVAGGTKVVSGVNLSPRSTRGYLRTSLRCKQESVRVKSGATRRSPVGKFPANTGEWKRMSLPAMLVGETVGEILQASQFAREIVSAVGKKSAAEDPKTPMSQRSNKKVEPENTQLKARRKKEKQTKAHNEGSPSLQRARSRINFKVSPPKVREFDKESNRYMANRVSPRNRPWARKTVLFPNPLFLSTHSSSQPQQQQFCKTRSPIISRNRGTTSHKFLIKSPTSQSRQQQFCKTRSPSKSRGGTPHKFLIKSPSSTNKFQVQIKNPPTVSISPTRPARLSRSPPKRSTASKFRRSFSPSRIASRLVSLSPLRTKKTVQKNDGFVSGNSSQHQQCNSSLFEEFKKTVEKNNGFVSGLKQRPASTMQFPVRRV
ncbi:Kinesin-like protein KIN-14S, partial [Mucuna pruriens]